MSRNWVVILSIASIATAFVGLTIGFYNKGPAALQLPLMLATAIPYMLILAFTFSGAWHRACALAVGTATVAFLGLILFAGAFTLFLGFSMGNRDQIGFVLFLDAFVAIQLLLGVVARKAKQTLPPEVHSSAQWGIAWGVPLGIAFGIVAGIMGFEQHNNLRVNNVYRNEGAAREALERVAACLKALAANDTGFPASLAAVGPEGTKCLDAETTAGKLRAHQLSYWRGAPDTHGKVRLYSLCAAPTGYPKAAWRTYVSDESNQTLFLEPQEKMLEPHTCSQAWAGDPLRRAKHCLVIYAAANSGYPRTLDEVDSGATGCLAPFSPNTMRLTPESQRSGEPPVSYRPGAPDVNGRITAFELHGTQFAYPLRFKVMIDETGVAHAAKDRDAVRGDPAPEVLVQQITEQLAATKNEREVLWTQCDGGAADICIKLALSEAGGPGWWTAAKYWKRGCEHGSEMSCVFTTRDSDPDMFALALSDQRDCDSGKAEGCQRIKQLARDFHGCNGDKPERCHGLARRIARTGNTRKANAFWDKGCKAGHAESCYFLQIRDFVYIKAMNLADVCDAGDTAQCRELNQLVKTAIRAN